MILHPFALGAVVAGVAATVGLAFHPYPLSWLIKVLPVTLLALLAWRRRAGWPLLFALAAHGAGDVILDVARERLFVAGLGAFLVGHLGYLAVFRPRLRPPAAWPLWIRGAVAGYGALALGLGWIVVGGLEGPVLMAAVPLYIAVLIAMAMAGTAARWPDPRVPLGVACFVASDALLGINAFVAPFPGAPFAIWPSYVAAQVLIVTGVLDAS